MPSTLALGAIATALCSLSYLWLNYKKHSDHKYFPSPPSEPILGHLRVFPQHCPWETFNEWRKDYGGIIQLFVAGKSIVVVNDAEDAYNLMDKRGSRHADRVRSILVGEMTGLDGLLALTRYGEDFRALRRWTTQYFNSRDHIAMFPLMKGQIEIFLNNLLEDPKNFADHLDRLTSGTVVKSTYGHDIKSNDDGYVKMATEAVLSATSLGMMGLTPFDFVPLLRHVPKWVPGFGVVGKAEKAKVLMDQMVEVPFNEAVTQRETGGRQDSCFVDYLLDDYKKSGKPDKHHERLMKNAAGQIYVAGAETSADTFLTFFFFMAQHPEIQKKAQAELDKIIGTEHLPTLEDREDLPYIECIMKEVLRINPSLPFAIPHASMEDDIYKDRFIPGGSMIIPNIWAMMRDERYFPDPHTFNPDRFVSKVFSQDKDEHVHYLNTFRPDDPSILVFGFGRRACPGRYFADASVWLTIANVLAVFEILPPIDPATGKEIKQKFELVGGTTSRPKPFSARVVPRSEKHARLALNA